jgi:hypothetical protein
VEGLEHERKEVEHPQRFDEASESESKDSEQPRDCKTERSIVKYLQRNE